MLILKNSKLSKNTRENKMMQVGRVCTKIAGREAGKKCVVLEMHENNLVTVGGEIKTRKCSVKHLEPHHEVVDVSGDAESVYKELGFSLNTTKPRPATIRPRKERKEKDNKPKKK